MIRSEGDVVIASFNGEFRAGAAQQFNDALFAILRRKHARGALIDLSRVTATDELAINGLFGIATAAKLLGTAPVVVMNHAVGLQCARSPFDLSMLPLASDVDSAVRSLKCA